LEAGQIPYKSFSWFFTQLCYLGLAVRLLELQTNIDYLSDYVNTVNTMADKYLYRQITLDSKYMHIV